VEHTLIDERTAGAAHPGDPALPGVRDIALV